MKPIYLILFFICIGIITSCKKNNDNCISWDTVPGATYSNPIWNPSGKVIGFNHTPVITATTTGSGCNVYTEYTYQTDSTGFWLINSDGTNQRRALPHPLYSASWSQDGKWIAFINGGDIFKMPFDGQKFDTTAMVRLTFNGADTPTSSWNYLSTKIAYTRYVNGTSASNGIWLYDSGNAANPNQFLISAYAIEPSWFHTSDSFVYHTAYFNNVGSQLGDSVWIYSVTAHQKQFLRVITSPFVTNQSFQPSPDDSKIAFIAQSNIPNGGAQVCTINIDGSNFKQLTTSSTTGFSWGPDGRIVYVNFDYVALNQTDGTLWIMNADGSNKIQLTHNKLN